MLALATAHLYRDPWAPCPEDARLVPLADLMAEVDRYNRNQHTITAARRSLGIPTTNPGLERELQELGLWPEEAKPLPVDITQLLGRLPKRQQEVVYGRLAGLANREVASQLQVTAGAVAASLSQAQNALRWFPDCFGVVPPQPINRGGFISFTSLQKTLGVNVYRDVWSLAGAAGLDWRAMERQGRVDSAVMPGTFPIDCAVTVRTFPQLWDALIRHNGRVIDRLPLFLNLTPAAT